MSFCEALKSLTTFVCAAICWGWPPVPRPTNQRTTTPPLGPGWSTGSGADVTSGVGSAVAACDAAAWLAGAFDGVCPAQAVATMATIAMSTIGIRGPDRDRNIARGLLSLEILIDLLP